MSSIPRPRHSGIGVEVVEVEILRTSSAISCVPKVVSLGWGPSASG